MSSDESSDDELLRQAFGESSHSDYHPYGSESTSSSESTTEKPRKHRLAHKKPPAKRRASQSSVESSTSNKLSSEDLEERLTYIKTDLTNKKLVHRKRLKKSSSTVWNKFHEIYEANTNQPVNQPTSEKVVHNSSKDGNTNAFLRHVCLENSSGNSNSSNGTDRTNAKDLRPYSAVAGEGFLDVCDACMKFGQRNRKASSDDLFKCILSRNGVQNKIGERAAGCKDSYAQLLKSAVNLGGISATTDCWTDDYRHTTYISVVSHLSIHENDDISYHRIVLATKEVEEDVKTGEVLIKHIMEIFQEYGMTEEDIRQSVVFISDRGANIKSGLQKADFVRLTCYAHILHNLVTHMLKDPAVQAIIQKCADLCSYVKNSVLNKKLRNGLQTYTSTRWNSIYTMIVSIITSYDEVYDVLLAKQRAQNELRLKQHKQPTNTLTELVTSLNVAELNKIKDFLAPFKTMTDNLEGDKYVTLHMVWPIYLELFGILAENEFDDEPEDTFIYNMKRLGREYMSKHDIDFKPTFHHKLMTFLNPAMKKLKKISFIEKTELYKEIEKRYQTTECADVGVVLEQDRPSNSATDVNVSETDFLSSFMSFDEDIDGEPESEIQKYIKEPIKAKVNLKEWWLEHANVYPNLFKLFVKYSCIPATSASSESIFSTTGNIITDKRSMILPKNVNNLIIVRNSM